MANIDIIRRYITFNEGKRNAVYNDSLGIPTIGVGFNLKRGDAPAKIAALGLSYNDVVSGKQNLTDAQIDTLLDADIAVAENGTARKLFSNFDTIDPGRQVVLIDLSFNMGYTRLSAFKNTIAAVNARNWELAADELKNSSWYKQVGNRGVRNVEAMRSGKLPNF